MTHHVEAPLYALNTIGEVADFAKVSPRTVMRAIASGKLEALRAGTQVRITEAAVWAWLRGEEAPSAKRWLQSV